MENNTKNLKTAPKKFNLDRIAEKIERIKRAEIKEKEWLEKQRTSQSF